MPFATADQLNAAIGVYRQRGDTARAETCESMLSRVTRGLGLTAKANAYALDLIAKSLLAPQARKTATPSKLVKLFFDGGKLAQLDFGMFCINLKNDGTVAWMKYGDKLAGCIDMTGVKVFRSKLDAGELSAVEAILAEIERDPMAAAVAYGKKAGRCCVCSAKLTNPKSIDAGIGPICAGRLA